jgi:hypothetical protein
MRPGKNPIRIPVIIPNYTWDIAVFIPLTKFEYYLEK